MSAKEMFEELGYKEVKLTDEGLCALYEKQMYVNIKQCVYFYPEKEVRITYEDKGRVYSPIFKIDLLQPINKQVEELGWNNEKL